MISVRRGCHEVRVCKCLCESALLLKRGGTHPYTAREERPRMPRRLHGSDAMLRCCPCLLTDSWEH